MITGKQVILRPVRIEDWEYTLKWRIDLFLRSSTLSHPFPVTQELEKEWYERALLDKGNTNIPFTVVMKETGTVIGYGSLTGINWISRIAFVGMVIGERENIGRGLGKEAMELLLHYAFGFLNLNKVCGFSRADNPGLRTFKAIGAKTEGLLVNHFFADGRYYDVEFISWFSNEWKFDTTISE